MARLRMGERRASDDDGQEESSESSKELVFYNHFLSAEGIPYIDFCLAIQILVQPPQGPAIRLPQIRQYRRREL